MGWPSVPLPALGRAARPRGISPLAAGIGAGAGRRRHADRIERPGRSARDGTYNRRVFRPVDRQQSLPDLELGVLERWRERDVFAESVRRREGAPPWVFYEGPPTANGPPGSHHVLARVFKDIYPRYRTMRGYRVDRKGGWDCHGLPVEIAVEQQLGLHSKAEIEAFGIAEFNRRCRESVFEFLEDWDRLTERIGFWVDLEAAYRTLDDDYIESVWWALSQIFAKGLLYESNRVVPYCVRCGTALSSHEVSLGYEDVEDRTVYVKLPLHGSPGEFARDLDDDALDAAGQPRGRRRAGDRLRAGPRRRRDADRRGGARRARVRRRAPMSSARCGGPSSSAAPTRVRSSR